MCLGHGDFEGLAGREWRLVGPGGHLLRGEPRGGSRRPQPSPRGLRRCAGHGAQGCGALRAQRQPGTAASRLAAGDGAAVGHLRGAPVGAQQPLARLLRVLQEAALALLLELRAAAAIEGHGRGAYGS